MARMRSGQPGAVSRTCPIEGWRLSRRPHFIAADPFSSLKPAPIRISQGVHSYLKEKGVPHVWHVDEHAHDFQHWKKGLFQFSQRIFKPAGN